MPGTFTQLHIHVVFAVKYRQALIAPTWRQRLHQYLTATIQHEGHKALAVNGTADHVHLALGLRPAQALAELVQRIKQSSSRWINDERLTPGHFAWQEGYGAFAVSDGHLPQLLRYIEQQEQHHHTTTFREEYERLLRVNGIAFEEQFLFQTPQ